MEITAILILLFQVYLAITVVVLLLDNREPAETFAWLFIFVLMPVVGFIAYLIFGRNWKRAYDKRGPLPQFVSKHLLTLFKPLTDQQESRTKDIVENEMGIQDDIVRLLFKNAQALLTKGNHVDLYFHGQEKFDALKKDLRAAKKFIHLEYFIWRSNDLLGQELKAILMEKARAGVEVRILYDFTGCFFRLHSKYIRDLRSAGVEIYAFFNYLSNFKIHTINYRNHRKIVVIDGEVAYTGGMNVGQEYIDGGKRFASWRDTHMRVQGEAVDILQAIFAIDWYNTTSNEDVLHEKYFLINQRSDSDGSIPMQLPTSGYDSRWPSILHSYFSVITMAQKYIYLTTPYFIPEPSVLTALKTAAMRGVDVVILLTGVPDQLLPYWAAFSYFDELLSSGVKIYHYKDGFMHAKTMTCDDVLCSVGTANFDIRSFKLNYEVNAMMYDKKITQQLNDQFAKDLEHAREYTLADLKRKSFGVRMRNSLVRLMSPLM